MSIFDDPDDFDFRFNDPSPSNNSNMFHIKVIINALSHWRGSLGDESFLRQLLERFARHTHYSVAKSGWSDNIKKMEDEWLATNPENVSVSFPNYAKFLNSDDINKCIIEPLKSTSAAFDQPFVASTTCQTLATLLDLTYTETALLQLSLYMKNLEYPYDSIYPRITNIFENKERVIAGILGVSSSDIKSAMNGFLIKSGFIVPSQYPDGFFTISPVFEDIFDDPNIGLDRIEDVMFPNSLSTDLTDDDYGHIKKDMHRVEKIISNSLTNKTKGTNILLWGPAGMGKTELCVALAQKNGWNIRSIGDISSVDTDEKSRAQRLGNLKIALKLFNNDGKTVLVFDEFEDIFKTDTNANFSKAFINRIIETTSVPIIWTTNSLTLLGSPVLRRMSYNIHCTTPPRATRRLMWEKYADKFGVNLDEKTKNMLDIFDIPPALISNTMKVTASVLENDRDANQDDVREIATSLDRLINFGEKRRFDLFEDKDNHLYDSSCTNADHNLDELTDRLVNAKSHAFGLCLYGPSGTGKSKYARYLSTSMGKQFILKRASDLISKWVGGTEELIAEAFTEAKENEKVLIIDEGDTFLRNREKATASWEVSQVNEMLSQMESHTQPFILTTNLMDDIDSAALRRFTFKMKFDYMLPEQSVRLFQRYFGSEPPIIITKNDILAPGDFANVKTQVDILGITDPEKIYQMLLEECRKKPTFSKPMGF